MTLTDATDVTIFGTATTAANGTFSGTGTIPADNTPAHLHLTPGDPFAARFAPFPPQSSINLRLSTIQNNNIIPNAFTYAPGYYCSQYVYYPLAATLTLVDNVIGTCTLFNDGTGNGWIGTQSYNFPLCTQTPPAGGCPAFGGLTVTYKIASPITSTIQYGCRFVSSCPNNAGGTILFANYTPDTVVENPFSATTATAKVDQIGLYCYCNGGPNCVKLTIHE